MIFNDLGLTKELENRDFRNQFFRTEREIDIPFQIKSLRKLRKMNQAELAEIAGTKQSAISRLERSQDAKWELETLVKLAEALSARLAVTIEPFEDVIARYRAEETNIVVSAASAKSDVPQENSDISAILKVVKERSNYESSGNRKQSNSVFDSTSSPKRSAVFA